jgi:hypothetical protein
MSDTLGLLEESMQLARDLGYRVREEPLGELPGGPCSLGGTPHILLNMEQTPADRLAVLLRALVADPRVDAQPLSRLLKYRLEMVRAEL